MKQSRRGMTITELLVVVSVISILTSMMSPILLRAYRESARRGCMSNMNQIGMALQLVANDNRGKLPQCFDTSGTAVTESSWWYRKVAGTLYPHEGTTDQLTVRHNDDAWWSTNHRTPLQKFSPDRIILRCPVSRDPYYDRTVVTSIMPRRGWASSSSEVVDNRDKDRVYDDNYGYSAIRFIYGSGTYSSLPNPESLPSNNPLGVTTNVYKPIVGAINPITGAFSTRSTGNHNEDYIGRLADPVDPAGTILLMDYIKADAQPDENRGSGQPRTVGLDGLYGYRFRHGDRANVLFVDGHVEGYRRRTFLAQVGGTSLHWWVKLRP